MSYVDSSVEPKVSGNMTGPVKLRGAMRKGILQLKNGRPLVPAPVLNLTPVLKSEGKCNS